MVRFFRHDAKICMTCFWMREVHNVQTEIGTPLATVVREEEAVARNDVSTARSADRDNSTFILAAVSGTPRLSAGGLTFHGSSFHFTGRIQLHWEKKPRI
ncbi:predicted protein [Plenodomus lingam JN3]|uniref:Predicted protein n=1 Tax=Leptosphaeria maculans (strain JN3 / isolate v23.1.3 / race Av1-4-5-6-7-8) TaxID=985895 RepID=E4ZWM0_LEPMJ|nr:predicted protein [Plenodomus lingam JN3]CBX95996.1 predicted protein [Plenodomus lingam JN3]